MNKKIKYLSLTLVIIGLLFFTYFLKSSNLLSIDFLKEYVLSFGYLAPIMFILLYILITLLGISAAFLTILAGVIFGVFKGLLIVVFGATIAATIAFYISRFLKHKFFNKEKSNSKIVKKIFKKIGNSCDKNGFVNIALLRLSFMPYIPLSYAAGLINKLKARDFILATFVTNIFGSFVFIYLGNSLTQSIPLFLGAIVLLLLFMQIPKIIKRFNFKKNID